MPEMPEMPGTTEEQTRKSRPAIRWGVALLVCVVLTAGLATFKVMQIKAAIAYGKSFPEPSATVETMVTSRTHWQPKLKTIGTVVVPQTVVLSAELGGRVTQVNAKSGSMVKTGDILLQLDISEEQAKFQAAKANKELARLALLRIKKLHRDKTASEEKYDQARAQLSVMSAEVKVLKAIIEKKTVRAPFDAKVGLHRLEVGQLLQSGDYITTLVGLNDYLWIDFTLPLSRAVIKVEDSVQVDLSGIKGATLKNHHFIDALIIAEDTVVSAATRNLAYRAQVEIQNSFNANKLKHNAIVDIYVPTAVSQEVVIVPKTAIKRDSFGSYVFVLTTAQEAATQGMDTPEGAYRAERRSVKLGEERALDVVIAEGLGVNELIVAKGAYKLKQDLLVYVKSQSAGE